jgi:hypothetical protein
MIVPPLGRWRLVLWPRLTCDNQDPLDLRVCAVPKPCLFDAKWGRVVPVVRLVALRARTPGAPATEGSAGGAERLGKITSNVSVPTHADEVDT